MVTKIISEILRNAFTNSGVVRASKLFDFRASCFIAKNWHSDALEPRSSTTDQHHGPASRTSTTDPSPRRFRPRLRRRAEARSDLFKFGLICSVLLWFAQVRSGHLGNVAAQFVRNGLVDGIYAIAGLIDNRWYSSKS